MTVVFSMVQWEKRLYKQWEVIYGVCSTKKISLFPVGKDNPLFIVQMYNPKGKDLLQKVKYLPQSNKWKDCHSSQFLYNH